MTPESKAAIIAKFAILSIGKVLSIPLLFLKPSQPYDGRKSKTNGPIEAYTQDGDIVVQHGNHRYHDMKSRGSGNRKIQVRKVESPIDHIRDD